MLNFQFFPALTLAALLAGPVMAQQAGAPAAGAMPPGVVATTNNPNLAVSAVKLETGSRLSKVIGSAVYAEGNEKVGTVDDLIMAGDNQVAVAIIAVGGVLGLGSKLVALPFPQIKVEAERVLLPGVTKDGLNLMPSFVY